MRRCPDRFSQWSGQLYPLIDTLNTPHVPVRLSRAYAGMLCQGGADKKEELRLDVVGPDSTAIKSENL